MTSSTVPNPVIIAGAEAVQSGAAPTLRDIAERTNIGVLNTWPAKGLFPWNHPAHLGTIGLQADDLVLAGLGDFDDVILCGVSDDEIPRRSLDALGARWREVLPADLASLRLPIRDEPTPRPRSYDALSAVCQPMFLDDSLPVNPARAAADLAAALPDGGVVCGDISRSGFWLGRALPTRTLGSVQLPVRAAAGFAATQAAIARRTGRFSIAVVDDIDTATETVMSRATDLVVEVWCDDAPPISIEQRVTRLHDAHREGGVHSLRLAVRFGDIDGLRAVAGEPLWGYATSR
jgi:Thiamine pyrophosphate enzyme, central domain